MFITVWSCVGFALLVNRAVFNRSAEFELSSRESWRQAFAVLKA
jgi:solute:Na+ symporter, SSS family